jgi:diguanylate cyclase (GGDEF)-like protein/PAS domain S-box-containing protein
MDKKKNSLRAAAEEQFQHASTTNSEPRSAEELLYELQVHQIELEMQNENLRQSNEALAESRRDYLELYEFAPVGYLTLSQQGLIEKINLTGATLLGKKFPQLLQRRFAGFINATDTDRWHLFFAHVMRGNQQKTLEVSLKQPNDNWLCVQLHCLRVLNENKSPTLRIALTDITEIKQVAAELVIANTELAFQNTEKENRASELVIANVELAFQNKEKENRAAELVIANKELAFQNEEKELRAIERRKIEDALQKSELKLKFLLSNAPVTIFTCKPTPPFNLTYISPNISEILGYLPKQFLENCSSEQFLKNCSSKQFLENCNFWEENIHPDDVAQLYKHLSQFPKNGTFQHEFRFRTADGSYRWMYDELRLMRDEAGEANQIIGFWVDITERKQAEKRLKESEERLQIAKLSASIGIWDYDIVADIVNWDDRMREIWEFSAEKTIHYADWINNLHPDDRLPAQNAIDKALMPTGNGYFHVEYRVIAHCTQQEHWIMATGQTFFVQKQPTRMIGTVQDITERKRLEKSLRDSESKFRALYDSTSDSIMLLSDTLFFDCNQAALTLFGCKTIAEFCTYHPADLSPLEQPCGTSSLILEQQYIATALKIGSFRFEWTYKRIDTGEIFVAEVLLSALIVNEKPVLQATARDITERKAAEDKIQQLAFFDPLTGLPNRRKLLDRLQYAIAINRRKNSQFAVFMMDLDKFKAVNDKLGHAAGDELLKQVAARIIDCLRESDMVARLGGDEFVLILENLKIPDDAETIALKVIADLTRPFQLSGNNSVQIGASIGISLYPQHGNTPESLMDHADNALYQAKDNGRGCFAYFSGNELTLL